MVRTAGQQRPDRSIMDDLCPRRDYPMSTHPRRYTYAAFRSVVSTAKANGRSILNDLRQALAISPNKAETQPG